MSAYTLRQLVDERCRSIQHGRAVENDRGSRAAEGFVGPSSAWVAGRSSSLVRRYHELMRATRCCLIELMVAAAAAGISVAAPAAADPQSNICQSTGGAVVCAQGRTDGAVGGQSDVAPSGGIPPYSGGSCATQYGTYQNCIVQQGIRPSGR